MVKKLLGCFRKKNCRKRIKKSLKLKKKSREKVINYMLNGKVMTILVTAGSVKKT